MPITTSAKKALRAGERKRVFNNTKKDLLNKALKQVKKLVSEKKVKEARTYMSEVQRIIDKSVKTGLLKRNTAARKKSRLMAFIKKAK
ncbi:MAG TPA: 30S ribosomal protein S20 [Candidatus Paceibacterota bacterium]